MLQRNSFFNSILTNH